MDYSHTDRLEGFRTLYMTLAGEQKDFYEAKEQWESVSEGLDEVYFWTALEDLYQNNLVDIDGFQLSGSTDLNLQDLSVREYEALNRVRVPREWKLESNTIDVFTDHFKRHDDPDPDDYNLGRPRSSLEIRRSIDKGEKSIEYLLENDSEEEEASLRLEVEFNMPSFSPEVEKVFLGYADNYLNKLERQEVKPLMKRDDPKSDDGQKSAAL